MCRGVTALYEVKALYTAERSELENLLLKDLLTLTENRGIVTESTQMRQPAGLTPAIEEKLQAEQESQRMQFILQKEK
jgi:prohibitin 1